MTIYEFIKTHEEELEQMSGSSIYPPDVQYLELYREYMRLVKEGHKRTYIISYLSEQYEVSERTVYRIVDRFSKKIDL